MVCLGLEPRVAGWKVQTNPLSYGGSPYLIYFINPVNDCLLLWGMNDIKNIKKLTANKLDF